MARAKLLAREEAPADPRFLTSGSYLFDCALAGGYGRGRIINIVGDRSTGKTGLVVEAFANLARIAGAKYCRYGEAENAFDDDYARILGMPEGVQRPKDPLETVEDFQKDLDAFLEKQDGRHPCMYALDSLDALSDDAEMAAKIGTASYGTAKAKAMSQLFRRTTGRIADANCTLIIVSQIRDKIGAMFGEKHTRSGGKALDFYASQIIWLSELKKLYQQALNSKRAVGIEVKARVKKNKMGLAFREAEMTILFNYGIDDETTMLNWLYDVKADKDLSMSHKDFAAAIDKARQAGDRAALRQMNNELRRLVKQRWQAIDKALEPPMRKYG